jgi:DMSO/TMAO reductase YedYZ molybdopterin-dependent catalytic subunit
VFYSLADGADGARYYDVHSIADMRHERTILAYEMNGARLSLLHGASWRPRCENELGFKTIKWTTAVEFAHAFPILARAWVATTRITNFSAIGCRSE